jgi:MYXO-CTERM domain-containing protein
MTRRSALAVAAFVALVAALQPSHDAVGAAKNKAGIVVRYGDGRVEKMCVFFDEPSISGLDLLDRSGETYVAEKSALGSAICKIDDQGCAYPSEDCFCKYPNFWGYWNRDPDEPVWEFASTGAADHEVRDGSVDGWSWGPNGAPAPPLVAFEDVCPASATGSVSQTSRPSKGGKNNAGGGTTPTPSDAAGERPTDRNDPSASASAPGTDRVTTMSAEPTLLSADEPVAPGRPNYTAFAGFALLFALLAAGAVVLRRRRTPG